ncbi:hypothetical protein DIPPA_00643 [Diplonema papillatum]|nr:hypothetical protein DIPPA_00643 [Diplonema papillatum]
MARVKSAPTLSLTKQHAAKNVIAFLEYEDAASSQYRRSAAGLAAAERRRRHGGGGGPLQPGPARALAAAQKKLEDRLRAVAAEKEKLQGKLRELQTHLHFFDLCDHRPRPQRRLFRAARDLSLREVGTPTGIGIPA